MSSWTADRIALMSRLWAEGWSAAKIAKELGGVSRVAVIGKVHRLGLSEGRPGAIAAGRPKPAPKPTKPPRLCRLQGCGKVLGRANLSGVCKDHAHVAGACQCPKCKGEVAVRRAISVPRPHVRVALVATNGIALSGSETRHIRVSLPREPWVTA